MRKMTWSDLHLEISLYLLVWFPPNQSLRQGLEWRQFTVFGRWPQWWGGEKSETEKSYCQCGQLVLNPWVPSQEQCRMCSRIVPLKDKKLGTYLLTETPIGGSLASGPLHPLSWASCTEIRSELDNKGICYILAATWEMDYRGREVGGRVRRWLQHPDNPRWRMQELTEGRVILKA